MPFNIEKFSSNISKYGVIQNNKFDVSIVTPNVLRANTPNINGAENLIKFRTDSFKLPALIIDSKDVATYGVGVKHKFPYTSIQSDAGFSVICDSYGTLWEYFYKWLREIHQFNGTGGTNGSSTANYTVSYKQDYATTIQVKIYDQAGQIVEVFDFIDAFPVSINSLQLAWGDRGQPVRLGIAISYKEIIMQNA